LQRKQSNQPKGDAIEQRSIVTLERGVEQRAHDLWKRQPNRCRNEQAQRRDRQTSTVWTNQRKQSTQRFRRAKLSLRQRLSGR
jgi:hypothetical protein